MNPEITEPEEAAQPTNAVSIFGQGGSPNDFPVLKAFQEYLDAEQAKARKRMLGLSVFFILLLIVITITFMIVVMSVINRNQSLSDRLLDIALREKVTAQPVVNVQPPTPVVQPVVHQPSQEDTLKPVVDEIGKLTAALVKVQQQPVPVAQPTPVVVTTSPQPVVQSAAESAELIRLREELRREREERKAEKDAKEKEEKRQAEIEAHRRRLYPEYYAQQDARKAAGAQAYRPEEPVPQPVVPVAKPEPRPVPVTAMKPRSYLNETAEDPELKELLNRLPSAKPQPSVPAAKRAPQPVAQPPSKPVPKPAVQPAPHSKPAPKQTSKPRMTPAVQVPARQENKTETLTIGGADGNSIPWLIEIPQN